MEENKTLVPYYKDETIYIPISSGCLRRCTFCTYGTIKTRYYSVPRQQILDKICEAVLDKKVLHVCLTGDNTTEYGIDWDGKSHFRELIQRIIKLFPQLKILDIMGMTIDDLDSDPDLVKYLTCIKKICRVQLDIQALDEKVRDRALLRESGEYALYHYMLFRERKNVISNIIVGLPDEDEESFTKTVERIKNFGTSIWSLTVTPFSAIPGTKASIMRRCSEEEAERRASVLREVIAEHRERKIRSVLDMHSPVRAYVHSYGKKRDISILKVLNESIDIEVNGELPLYETVYVYPYEYINFNEHLNSLRFKGKLEDP